MAKDCLVEWRDQNGNTHKTKRYVSLIRAMRAAHSDAEKLGLEVKQANGVIVSEPRRL